jgi:hypothetical protein
VIDGFFCLTVSVKVEKYRSSEDEIDSSEDEEFRSAKAQIRGVNRAEFMSEMGNPLPEYQ